MIIDRQVALAFDDIHLEPQKSEVPSRSNIPLDVRLNRTGHMLRAPIIASPMDTISGVQMAIKIRQTVGGMAVLHRYCSIESQVENFKCIKRDLGADTVVGAAVGISGDYLDRASALINAGVDIICIDVAHGHLALMRDAIYNIRKIGGEKIHIMAGNIATSQGYSDLSDWGADSVRVGVGSGSICTTRVQTGHGVPVLQSLLDIYEWKLSKKDKTNFAQVICDGGMRSSGDIVKAIAVGADMVMTGSLLAGTDETPGEIVMREGAKFKKYRGMASAQAQLDWRGVVNSNEGIETYVPYVGSVELILKELVKGIITGLSYSGGENIADFVKKVKIRVVSPASAVEALPHIELRNKNG